MTETILIIGAIVVAAVLFFVLRSKKKRIDARAVDNLYANTSVEVPREFAFKYVTPLGVSIGCDEYSEIPKEAQTWLFADLDEAFQTFLRSTEHLGWIHGRKASEVGLIFLKPQATNQDGTPALVTKAKYGSIQNAGTVVGVGDGFPYVAVVLPANFSGNFRQYTKDAFRFESEHVGLYLNDKAKFQHYTGANDVHPIFTDPQGSKGFAAMKSRHSCGMSWITKV